jgi:hypothetical protein
MLARSATCRTGNSHGGLLSSHKIRQFHWHTKDAKKIELDTFIPTG